MSTLPDESVDALNCPLCGYDLRGLPEDRCPECGHAFDLDALRRARDERRDWFFECTSPRGCISAFARTAIASARPFAFWRRVSPAWPIAWPWLLAWAAAWAGLLLAIAIALLTPGAIDAWDRAHAPIGVWMPSASGGRVAAMVPLYLAQGATRYTVFDAIASAWRSGSEASATAHLAALLFAWPIATWTAMRLFAVTLGRAGVRAGHPWRCVAYAWPSAIIPATLAAAIAAVAYPTRPPPSLIGPVIRGWLWQAGVDSNVAEYVLLAAFAGSGLHLIAAHTRYLRLPSAVAQAGFVLIVAWLGLAALAVGAAQWAR